LGNNAGKPSGRGPVGALRSKSVDEANCSGGDLHVPSVKIIPVSAED
jgi:hypothetical protein